MKALLICNRPRIDTNASTISDHLDALNCMPGLCTYELSTIKIIPPYLNLDIFDVIIIHYTIQLGEFNNHFLNPAARKRIGASRGLKVAFIQDEYRETLRVHTALLELRIQLLYTLLSEKDVQTVYPKQKLPHIQIKRVLAAYVPKRLICFAPPPAASRPILVSYRARKMPVWLGSLAFEKWKIAIQFLEHSRKSARLINSKFDISWQESQRVYGNRWYELLLKSKCVLGVESGANILDVDGTLRLQAENLLRKNNNDYDYVYETFVKHHDNILNMNQIAARHFEACALGTVQILFEGSYSNILTPYRHYIPLKKDFSNFDQVVDYLSDNTKLQDIADCARKEITLSGLWSYEKFTSDIAQDIQSTVTTDKNLTVSKEPYSWFSFKLNCFLSLSYLFFYISSYALGMLLRIQSLRGLLVTFWHSFDDKTKKMLRPLLAMIGR